MNPELSEKLTLASLKARNNALYWFGWLNIAAIALALLMYFTDATMITGVNAWIKPIKFSISITLYAWTFAWLLAYLPEKKPVNIITWILILCMAAENVLIHMQAFRGVRSHFNTSSAFDASVFSTMGMFILVNTIIILYTIKQFFNKGVRLDPVMLWAWRFGLIFFFLGGISGGIMSARLAHTVGAPDGGGGVPFFNWSTVAGDIRMAHFFTLHGLQLIPLIAALLISITKNNALKLTAVFTVLYMGVCLWLHWMALNGLTVIFWR